MVSPYGLPVTAVSVPSSFAENDDEVGFPLASVPSALYVSVLFSIEMVTVCILGPGPVSNFDFSTFSFHVPVLGSSAACTCTLTASPASTNIVVAHNIAFSFIHILQVELS